jgi:FkbH-like protein
MVSAERARRDSATAAVSAQQWLDSLDIRVRIEPLSDANLDRAAQLFNKTNQMNLSTRRLTKSELAAWAAAPDHAVLTFRVSDRFGDSGLTGIVGLDVSDGEARLVDFLLSCRVMGRSVEEAMLHVAVDRARERGASTLTATLQPTPRNGPCLEFFRRSGMRATGEHSFAWSTSDAYERPRWVTIDAPHH